MHQWFTDILTLTITLSNVGNELYKWLQLCCWVLKLNPQYSGWKSTNWPKVLCISINFAVSGSATRNRLPVELRTSSLSIDTFTRKLNTHLFSWEHLWRLLFIRRYTNEHIGWLTDWNRHSKTWGGIGCGSIPSLQLIKKVK